MLSNLVAAPLVSRAVPMVRLGVVEPTAAETQAGLRLQRMRMALPWWAAARRRGTEVTVIPNAAVGVASDEPPYHNTVRRRQKNRIPALTSPAAIAERACNLVATKENRESAALTSARSPRIGRA